MKIFIHKLIRRFLPQADREAGFTLVELVVAAAAFTIICAGLTTLLITALRIQKYTNDNTNYRETVRMVRAFVKDQAADGTITVSGDNSKLQKGSTTILNCVQDQEHEGKYVLQAAGNIVAKNLNSKVEFQRDATNPVLTFTLEFDGDDNKNTFPITIYCPRGIEEESTD